MSNRHEVLLPQNEGRRVSVYSKDILMPNTKLTLIYNIIKVKRSDTLIEEQTISVYLQSAPLGLPALFCNKHGKYKNKDPSIKLF